MIEQDIFKFNTFAELNDYYFGLFLALSDVGPALSKKFLKIVENRILERYEYDYKLLNLDVKFSYKLFKRDKKQLQKRIRRAQRAYYKALKKGLPVDKIEFEPRYTLEKDNNGMIDITSEKEQVEGGNGEDKEHIESGQNDNEESSNKEHSESGKN